MSDIRERLEALRIVAPDEDRETTLTPTTRREHNARLDAILAGQGAGLTDAIDELIAGVEEIGCVYSGDLKAPQITGREEVIDGLRDLRRLTGGAK